MIVPPAPPPPLGESTVTFRYRSSTPLAGVTLWGDMIHWAHSTSMPRRDGAFVASISVPAGTYVYKVLRSDGAWDLDADNPRTRSVDGVRNSLLVVGGADEPLLHAPAAPYLALADDGRLHVRAGLRRSAGDTLALSWDEGDGPREAPMRAVAAEDEHLLFEATIPASAREVAYLFLLPGGRWVGRPGGAAQAFRASRRSLRRSTPAWWQDAVLYTIFVDRFRRGGAGGRWALNTATFPERLRAGGDLSGVVEALPYLQDLGVTALHLTPIALSRSAHRYNAEDPRAVDPALGGEAALVALLDAAHRRGLRVLLDVTVTHVHRDFFAFRDVRENGRASPYWGWFFCQEHPFREGQNPGYRHYFKGAWEEPLLRSDHPDVADYLTGTFERWARLGADGFRIDAAADVPLDLVRRITAAVRAIRPETAVFGEVMPENLHRWTTGALDAATDFPAQEALFDWLLRGKGAPRAAEVLSRRRFACPGPATTTLAFTATHDQARLLTKTRSAPAARLGHLFVLLRAAVPAILYGDEVGIHSTSPGRSFEDAWPDRGCFPWDEAAWDTETLALFRSALRLRREHPALRRGDEAFLPVGGPGGDGSALILRRSAGPDIVDVVLHAGEGAYTVPLPSGAPSGGRVLLALGEASVPPGAGAVTLGPWSAAVVERVPPEEVARAFGEVAAHNRLLGELAFREGHTTSLSLPSNLYLTVTEACNLRCRHCITFAPQRTAQGTARHMAPWVLGALREAFEAADYFGFVHGGESLVAPIFPDVLRAIQRARRGRRHDVHLLTNGALLDGERARRLVELGLTSVSVSLDGARPETNDPLREGGSFDAIVANLREVVRAREALGADLRIGISMVAAASTADDLATMGRLAVDLGVDWLKVEEMFPATPAARRDLLMPRAPRMERRLAELREVLRGSRVVLVDHRDPPQGCGCEAAGNPELAAFRAADDFANRARFHPCRMLWEQACVDPDGTVRPVDYHHPPIGNLSERSLFAMWHGDTMAALRAEALARIPESRRASCPSEPPDGAPMPVT